MRVTTAVVDAWRAVSAPRQWVAIGVLGGLVAAFPSCGFAKNTGLIFVSNEKTNNLIIIDSKTNKVVRDLKVSRRPRDMHFNADHIKLYVACGDDDVIDVIDVATLEIVDKLTTGSSPETFAIDEKRRRIYVSNEEASSVSVIDMDQNITVHEVPTGAEPEGVFVSEDGRNVYVTSEVGDLVHRVDAESGVVEEDVVVGTRPRRFAATPDGKELWVSTELSGEVYIIERTKFGVVGKMEFLPPGMRKSDVTPVDLLHLRVVHLDRCAFVATPRTTAWPPMLFLVVEVRRRAFRQHQRTYRAGRHCLGISRPELRRDGMEGYRTTSTDYLDGLPPWWASALVRLFGIQKRSLLRTPGGGALWRRAVVCLPRLLRLGPFKPAAISSRSKPEPRSKDPDEARRQPELGGAVPAQTKGNAHAHIRAL
jgi:YVTN family beta-propeller protein